MTDAELLSAFEAASISASAFTHRAHVRTAYLLVIRHGAEGALAPMRGGLSALNALHGAPDELERGYHETMTLAFLRLIGAMIAAHGAAVTSDAFCDAHPQLMTKYVLRLYYTRSRLISWEAKREFVEPDLAPLPSVRATPPHG